MRRGLLTALLLVCAAVFITFVAPNQLSSDPTPPAEQLCGTHVTPEQAALYLRTRPSSPPLAPRPQGWAPPTHCVPIVGHIVRRSDGTGGLSLSQYQQSIDDSNVGFANTGIQYYTLAIDYIDSDFYYSGMTSIADINLLRQENVISAAINVYYTPVLPGLCGISSFTFSPVQGIAMANGCSGVPSNPSTMPHEIGHYFDLFHTHEPAFGLEYVNGTNCNSAGDLLCDTPADPQLGGINVTGGCLYVGNETDPLGASYSPDTRQIMSYSRSTCRDTFSPLSESKAVTTLLNSRPELLSRGCSPSGAAAVTNLDPPVGFVDQNKIVMLVGANLGVFTQIDMGTDITINNTDAVSAETLLVNITIGPAATAGPRAVIVNNAFEPDTLEAGFTVQATPIHYVSVAGSAIYPYALPSEAALTLADASAAAGDGDSIKVDSTTVSNVSFVVEKAVVVSGGWINNFATQSTRTTLNLNGHVTLASTSGPVGLDGFLLQNGAGTLNVLPIIGNYGGGVQIVNTTASVTNCEIRLCDANAGSGFAGGGGIFGRNSTVTISDNYIHDNVATYGGAIHLYQCDGTISNNTVENNVVAQGGAIVPRGGGVALQECGSVTLNNNTITGNAGAQNGGGVWFSLTTLGTMSGGVVSTNTASLYGGGVAISTSTVGLTGVLFSQNVSSVCGGAIASLDTSGVTSDACTFLWNQGIIGGGVYASTGTAAVRHGLFVGNSATSSGGGLWLQTLTGGEIIGNTLDRNTAPLNVGGIAMTDVPLNVFNNIVTNSTGDGVSCVSGLPTLAYNLVWNSSGSNYSGCSAGAGSAAGDPEYADTSNTDYRLTLNSPAIDAGDPNPAYDDPDGSRGDMGAYGSHSFTMEQPSYPQNLAVDNGGSDVILNWDRNPEGDINYYAIYCDTLIGFTPSATNLFTTTTDTTANLGAAADTTYYRVSAVNTSTYASGYSDEAASQPVPPTPVDDVASFRNALQQNVPNPFNPTTLIVFSVAEPVRVRLTVYDVAGRRVRTLISAQRPPNNYRVTWDGTNDASQRVASGIYFYRLEAGNFVQTRKMLLLK